MRRTSEVNSGLHAHAYLYMCTHRHTKTQKGRKGWVGSAAGDTSLHSGNAKPRQKEKGGGNMHAFHTRGGSRQEQAGLENTRHRHWIPTGLVGSDSGILFPNSRRNPRSCSLLLQDSIFWDISVSREQLANNLRGSEPQARPGTAGTNHGRGSRRLCTLIHRLYDGVGPEKDPTGSTTVISRLTGSGIHKQGPAESRQEGGNLRSSLQH